MDTSEFGPVLPAGGPQMEMKSDRALLVAVLSTVRYPMLLVDREGRIEAVSHAAADLLAVSPDAIRGGSVGEIAGSHGFLLHNAVASVVARARLFTTELRNDGRWFEVVVEAGELVGERERCPEP